MKKPVYDKQRHILLLKLEFSQENSLTASEQSELREYQKILNAMLTWETKEQYLSMLQKLNSGKINLPEFFTEIVEQVNFHNNVYDSLTKNCIVLSPHEKSWEFNKFMGEIIDRCYRAEEVFNSDLPKEEYDSYILKLSKAIDILYLKIQELLMEE